MNLPLRRTGLSRQTQFSFSCSRCLHCCRHKRIQINPYEVARLAANRGLDTADFIAQYTRADGTVLEWDEAGACVFLTPQGCGVHPDRPLVCRLYPLGRHVSPTGEEHFSEIEPDQECGGAYATAGVIGEFLAEQGVAPYIAAAGNYLDLFWRLCGMLEDDLHDAGTRQAVTAVLQGGAGFSSDLGLADLDAIVAAYCETLSRPVPASIEERMSLHIQAIDAWAHAQRRD